MLKFTERMCITRIFLLIPMSAFWFTYLLVYAFIIIRILTSPRHPFPPFFGFAWNIRYIKLKRVWTIYVRTVRIKTVPICKNWSVPFVFTTFLFIYWWSFPRGSKLNRSSSFGLFLLHLPSLRDYLGEIYVIEE